MARSSYIYLVPRNGVPSDNPFSNVRAAFTVKWEAYSYCERNELPKRVYRVPDGHEGEGLWLTEKGTVGDAAKVWSSDD